jgi:hypothetical protein
VVQAGEFGFCSRGHHIFEDAAHSMDGAIVGGSVAGGLVGSTGLLLGKKWRPVRLQAFASERYKGLLWTYKIMSLALTLADAGIRIGGSIVEETDEGLGGFFSAIGLSDSKGTKCHKHGCINHLSVVEERADNLLEPRDAFRCESLVVSHVEEG